MCTCRDLRRQFFSRDQADRTNLRSLFPNIAYQIGNFHRPFKEHLAEAVSQDWGIGGLDPRTQLERLIVNVRKRCNEFPPTAVIIIDALDECDDEGAVRLLLGALSNSIRPSHGLKFLITSRPEHHIRMAFTPQPSLLLSFALHDIPSAEVNADIEKYLRNSLSGAARHYPDLDFRGWPSEDEIAALVKLSSQLFIVAAILVRILLDDDHDNPISQLHTLLELSSSRSSSSSWSLSLDNLYLGILRRSYKTSPTSEVQEILGSLLALESPLSAIALERLRRLQAGTVRTALRRLHSVIIIPEADALPIRLIHPTFFEFLTTRCPDIHFRVTINTHHDVLFLSCLWHLERLEYDAQLQPRMSQDQELPRQHSIAPELRYACLAWMVHLRLAERANIEAAVESLLINKLLIWLKIVVLCNEVPRTVSNIRLLADKKVRVS